MYTNVSDIQSIKKIIDENKSCKVFYFLKWFIKGLKINWANELFQKYQFGQQTINGLILANEQKKRSILANGALENTKIPFRI